MTKVYQDTNTNAEQKINAWIMLWSLLFGGLYFLFKGMWLWAAVFVFCMIMTSFDPVVSLVVAACFAAFSPKLVEEHYIRKGWKLRDGV